MLMIRFERGRDNVIGPTFGPFDYVQLTYHLLRVSPNGDDFAVYHDGDWRLVHDGVISTNPEDAYSDVIVWTERSLE